MKRHKSKEPIQKLANATTYEALWKNEMVRRARTEEQLRSFAKLLSTYIVLDKENVI